MERLFQISETSGQPGKPEKVTRGQNQASTFRKASSEDATTYLNLRLMQLEHSLSMLTSIEADLSTS